MAFWRRISDNVLGEAGPAQIVVTPRDGNVLIRLPNQRFSRDYTVPWLVVALIIGSITITAAVRAGIERAEQGLGFPGQIILIGLALVAMSASACAWRVVWHYEIMLGADFLRVDCISSFRQKCVAEVELGPIRQLTLVRAGTRCTLQAESATEAPVPILVDQKNPETMRELARLIVQHHALLAPGRAELRIGEEVNPHVSAMADRDEPPLNSKVEVETSHAGLTFDFPLPDDARPIARKEAWRYFEIAIAALMGAVLWYAICTMAKLDEARAYTNIPFIAGVVLLVVAASRGMSSWIDHQPDDDLRQLSVLEKMLVRTSRDHRKKIWYGNEIRTIRAVIHESSSTSEGGQVTVTYSLSLVLELHNGQQITLVKRGYLPSDYRPKAEYEWLATKLRHALAGETSEASAVADRPASTGILQLGREASEEHVTPTAPASPRRD